MKMLGQPTTYARYLAPSTRRATCRRNKARERQVTRREVLRETARPHHVTWLDEFSARRLFDMNDEYQCPSTAVWRALVENEHGLRDVDFNGTYVTESERV